MQIPAAPPAATVILPKERGKRMSVSGENGEKGFDRPQVIGL